MGQGVAYYWSSFIAPFLLGDALQGRDTARWSSPAPGPRSSAAPDRPRQTRERPPRSGGLFRPVRCQSGLQLGNDLARAQVFVEREDVGGGHPPLLLGGEQGCFGSVIQ